MALSVNSWHPIRLSAHEGAPAENNINNRSKNQEIIEFGDSDL